MRMFAPRGILAQETGHTRRWVAFCAASVETPAPFKRRDVLCGKRMFQHMSEQVAWTWEAMEKGLTDQDDMCSYFLWKLSNSRASP